MQDAADLGAFIASPVQLSHTKADDGRAWCGTCYTNMRGRTNVAGHRGYRHRDNRRPWYSIPELTDMKRPTKTAKPEPGTKESIPDPMMAKEYPSLSEHLTDETYDDGQSRERSTLTIFVEDGRIKAALNDRDNKQSMYASSDSLRGVLKLLENALANDKAEFRPWKRGKK